MPENVLNRRYNKRNSESDLDECRRNEYFAYGAIALLKNHNDSDQKSLLLCQLKASNTVLWEVANTFRHNTVIDQKPFLTIRRSGSNPVYMDLILFWFIIVVQKGFWKHHGGRKSRLTCRVFHVALRRLKRLDF